METKPMITININIDKIILEQPAEQPKQVAVTKCTADNIEKIYKRYYETILGGNMNCRAWFKSFYPHNLKDLKPQRSR